MTSGLAPLKYYSLLMSSSCQNLLDSLKECVLYSDCVVKDGNLPSKCIKEHASELPLECQSLRKAVFECKRGMVRGSLSLLSLFIAYFRVFLSWTCENDSEEITQDRSLLRHWELRAKLYPKWTSDYCP